MDASRVHQLPITELPMGIPCPWPGRGARRAWVAGRGEKGGRTSGGRGAMAAGRRRRRRRMNEGRG